MPELKGRQEKFAQAIAQGETATKAYVLAGYKPSDAHCSRLAGNGRVIERVAELRAPGVKRTETTVERLLDAGWSLFEAAKRDGAYVPASSTLERIAKIAGHFQSGDTTNINLAMGVQFVDAPPDETREQWEKRTQRAGMPVIEVTPGERAN